MLMYVSTSRKHKPKMQCLMYEYNYYSTYFVQLFKLSIAELIQSVCVSFLHSAQSHVADSITHFTHI